MRSIKFNECILNNDIDIFRDKNFDKMTSTEVGHQPWKNDDCPDDSLSDSM